MNFKCLSRLLGILGCLAVFGVAPLMANENYFDWAKHMEVTFPGCLPPNDTTLTDFPVLVALSNTTAGVGFNYADFLSPPYGDLRFTAADKETPLDYEVERWDTDGLSHVWVKVPELDGTTSIYAFWGKAGVTPLPCTTNGAVWESNYAAVYHLSDAASGAHDSTANALNAKNTYSVTDSASAAGRGGLFDGSTSYINMGNNAAIEPTHLTLSAWVQVTGPGSNNDISGSWLISKGRAASGNNVSYALAHRTDNGKLMLLLNGRANVIESTTTHPANSPAFHVAATYDGSYMRLYVNGQFNTQAAKSPVIGYGYSDNNLHLGGWNLSEQFSRRFKGLIDEVRISKIARSPDWIWAEYLMIASNGVINAYGAPEIASAVATLGTIGTTNVTTGSAWLNGMLISTGTSATAVSAWWGTDDGTNNAAVWDNSATLPAPRLPGPFTFAATGLTPDSTYYYRFSASNDTGVVWSEESYSFITGNVWLETVSDASEIGPVPGTVTVHRAATAAAEPLTVNYSIGGTAAPGADYVPLSGKVTLAAGEDSAVIAIVPLTDHLAEGDETVVITLQEGAYVLDNDISATVVIEDLGQVTRSWRGAVSALASAAGNWAEGEIPITGDKILLDAGSNNKPMLWDIDVAVGDWEQASDYNGTVTFSTFYPGRGAFTNVVINGDVDLQGGIWTHAANSGDSEVSRLQVTVSGDFNLGAGASINLDGKGFGLGKGPGAGGNGNKANGFSASHGGPAAKIAAGKGIYGSIMQPENLGSGANGSGGGALKLTVAGTVTINGTITAQGTNPAPNNEYCHGSGGSILIYADGFAGSGTIRAGIDQSVRTSYYGSGGGRIALYAADSSDFSGLNINTYTYNAFVAGYNGHAGTIFLASADGERLVVDQGNFTVPLTSVIEVPERGAEFVTNPAFTSVFATVSLTVTNGANVSLMRDLRMKGVDYLDGRLALNAWTLYLKDDAPVVPFPDNFGGGTIELPGIFYTFENETVERDGRLLWGNSNVTWRVVTLAKPQAGGTMAIDSGASEGFYADNSEPELLATAESGYTFGVWDNPVGNGNTSDNPITLPPLVSHRALRAWFTDQLLNPATNTWSIHAATSDWFDMRNWESLSVPTAGQTVIIPDGATVMLTNATPRLTAFIFDGDTITLDGWTTKIDADLIHLKRGIVTHAANSATEPGEGGVWVANARVWLTCDSFMMESAANINADARGYSGGNFGTGAAAVGFGPGGGAQYNGGSHGGLGGHQNGPQGIIYGDAGAPQIPGSGGGGSDSNYAQHGGAGGGVVRLEVTGHATINGTISADGGRGAEIGIQVWAGGSGGSIWLTCGTIATTGGAIHANGGAAPVSNIRSGGGGRIALAVTDAAAQALLPAPRFKLSSDRGLGNTVAHRGNVGTVHLPHENFLPDHLTTDYIGLFGGFGAWQRDSVTVDNVWFGILEDGFSLFVTNNLQIVGSNARFDLTGAMVEVGGEILVNGGTMNLFAGEVGTKMSGARSLTLSNGANLYVYSGPTNINTTFTSAVTMGEAIDIGSGGTIYPHSHLTTGGSVIFRAQNFNVAAGSKVDADGAGFGAGAGPGRGYANGGGSHGGLGAAYSGWVYESSPVYGDPNAPVLPGSGGGELRGGGMIRIDVARQLTVNGTLSANGQPRIGNGLGHGSGGAIYLTCAVFAGSAGGVIRANGGNADGMTFRAGGGGRVALWRVRDISGGAVTAVALAGTNGLDQKAPSTDGTVVWGFLPASGTIIMLR